MTTEMNTFEHLKKEYKKTCKRMMCRMRFSSEQNITFSDEQNTIRARLSRQKGSNRCDVYLSGSLHHQSHSLTQLICDYFKDYAHLIGVNQVALHGHYPMFAKQGFQRFGHSSWVYFHTPWVDPISSFIQGVNETNHLLQQEDPTVDIYVGPVQYGVSYSPSLTWREIKLTVYKTGQTEQLSLGNPTETELRLLKGEDVFLLPFHEQKPLFDFLRDYAERIHRRARLETVFVPVKHYFDQCMSKCDIYGSKARETIHNQLLTHCDAEKLEELCASWVLSIKNEHSVVVRSKRVSLLSFFNEWYVISGENVAWFDEASSAISAFEEEVLAISLGKTLTKKLHALKTKG